MIIMLAAFEQASIHQSLASLLLSLEERPLAPAKVSSPHLDAFFLSQMTLNFHQDITTPTHASSHYQAQLLYA